MLKINQIALLFPVFVTLIWFISFLFTRFSFRNPRFILALFMGAGLVTFLSGLGLYGGSASPLPCRLSLGVLHRALPFSTLLPLCLSVNYALQGLGTPFMALFARGCFADGEPYFLWYHDEPGGAIFLHP